MVDFGKIAQDIRADADTDAARLRKRRETQRADEEKKVAAGDQIISLFVKPALAKAVVAMEQAGVPAQVVEMSSGTDVRDRMVARVDFQTLINHGSLLQFAGPSIRIGSDGARVVAMQWSNRPGPPYKAIASCEPTAADALVAKVMKILMEDYLKRGR